MCLLLTSIILNEENLSKMHFIRGNNHTQQTQRAPTGATNTHHYCWYQCLAGWICCVLHRTPKERSMTWIACVLAASLCCWNRLATDREMRSHGFETHWTSPLEINNAYLGQVQFVEKYISLCNRGEHVRLKHKQQHWERKSYIR